MSVWSSGTRPRHPDGRTRARGQVRLACALLLALLVRPVVAESGTVVEVIDGDTLRVRLGGEVESVRLIGVDTPEIARDERPAEAFAQKAAAFTKRLCIGKTVRLEDDPESANRDHYHRLLRYVFLPDGRLLNAEIISAGYGHAYTRFSFERLEAFRALERRAREGDRGLWRADPPRLGAGEAAGHVGKVATVCGVVASAKYADRTAGRPTFLNLDRPYPDQRFTLVVWGSDRAAFGRPEARYANRRVCATGKIRSFHGRAEMYIRTPSQITESGPGKPGHERKSGTGTRGARRRSRFQSAERHGAGTAVLRLVTVDPAHAGLTGN